MAIDLRKQSAPIRARRPQPHPTASWPYILTAITLTLVTATAVLMFLHGEPQPQVRIGSYAELAQTEAREGGSYAPAAHPCYVYETIPNRVGPLVRMPCRLSNEAAERPAGKNAVGLREDGTYAATPCWLKAFKGAPLRNCSP